MRSLLLCHVELPRLIAKRNSYIIFMTFEECFPCICSPAGGKHTESRCVCVYMCVGVEELKYNYVLMLPSLGAIIEYRQVDILLI